MKINANDKISLIANVYGVVLRSRMPYRQKRFLFVNPVDSIRYIEICFLLKSIARNRFILKNKKVLDVASPYIAAYLLSQDASVVKTDLSPTERQFIIESSRLKFQVEDGRSLSFGDGQFDLAYSISVIEHVYRDYLQVIAEMIRVTKENGFLYLTFPVSRNFREEWVADCPWDSYVKDGKHFFQYVFDEAHVQEMVQLMEGRCDIVDCAFYFLKSENGLDELTAYLRRNEKPFNILRNAFENFNYGMFGLKERPENLVTSRGIGVACILARKR